MASRRPVLPPPGSMRDPSSHPFPLQPYPLSLTGAPGPGPSSAPEGLQPLQPVAPDVAVAGAATAAAMEAAPLRFEDLPQDLRRECLFRALDDFPEWKGIIHSAYDALSKVRRIWEMHLVMMLCRVPQS
jgi:hypothetical protein